MTVSASPLTWPDGVPRSKSRAASQFKTSLASALDNVRKSLEAFARDSGSQVTAIVLSSNVSLGVTSPSDPGVAAWFIWDGAQRCIAVDRYPKVQDNLQAIHHILEARRTEMRHGGLHIVRQTLQGFVALPAPTIDWRGALRFEPGSRPSRADVERAYRAASLTAHPDTGGTRAQWDKLQAAYAAAKEVTT